MLWICWKGGSAPRGWSSGRDDRIDMSERAEETARLIGAREQLQRNACVGNAGSAAIHHHQAVIRKFAGIRLLAWVDVAGRTIVRRPRCAMMVLVRSCILRASREHGAAQGG